MMNIRDAQEHANQWIVPSPFATFRDGLACVGTYVVPGFDGELAVTAPTFEEAFELFGRVCPPSYLPVPVEAYAGTAWWRGMLPYLSKESDSLPPQ